MKLKKRFIKQNQKIILENGSAFYIKGFYFKKVVKKN